MWLETIDIEQLSRSLSLSNGIGSFYVLFTTEVARGFNKTPPFHIICRAWHINGTVAKRKTKSAPPRAQALVKQPILLTDQLGYCNKNGVAIRYNLSSRSTSSWHSFLRRFTQGKLGWVELTASCCTLFSVFKNETDQTWGLLNSIVLGSISTNSRSAS